MTEKRESPCIRSRKDPEWMFTLKIVAPPDGKPPVSRGSGKRKRGNTANQHEGNQQKTYVQKFPLTPFKGDGGLQTRQTFDISYSVDPSKPWDEMVTCDYFTLNEEKHWCGNFVYITSDKPDPWIAMILEIKKSSSNTYARVGWMYSPKDLPWNTVHRNGLSSKQQSYGKRELIASNHMDIINVTSVETSANVYHAVEGSEQIQEGLHWKQAFDCWTLHISLAINTNYWQAGISSPFRATVDAIDIPKLDEGGWLNDNLINFYICYLQNTLEKANVYFFNTYFFSKLKSSDCEIDYNSVETWTRNVDLFSYDYIIIPINDNNNHWYLAIVCNAPNAVKYGRGQRRRWQPPKPSTQNSIEVNRNRKATNPALPDFKMTRPKIIIFDSCGMPHLPAYAMLKDYFSQEAKTRKGIDLTAPFTDITATGIPLQNNESDCGVFVLGYIDKFLRNPDESTLKILSEEELRWKIDPVELRNCIRARIFDLYADQLMKTRYGAKAAEAAKVNEVIEEEIEIL